MAPVFLREWLGPRDFPREPEPALVMDDPEQVAAYEYAGRIDGVMAAAYLFHTARISQVIGGCRQILDLGCGPATQLGQIAALNPQVSFIGVDLSEPMLDRARRQLDERGLSNVEVRRDDITQLSSISDASVDGVISTMALHHLPTFQHLDGCFAQIGRVLRPGGALYLADFGRLKSLRSVLYFAYQNAAHQPHAFSLDYERSLRAAFELSDFEGVVHRHLLGRAHVCATFRVPFLVLVKSEDRPLTKEMCDRIRRLRRDLPNRYRRDLDDMRIFFRLGGLRGDPFSA
jgi:SAM-dependent methyltransferase